MDASKINQGRDSYGEYASGIGFLWMARENRRKQAIKDESIKDRQASRTSIDSLGIRMLEIPANQAKAAEAEDACSCTTNGERMHGNDI